MTAPASTARTVRPASIEELSEALRSEQGSIVPVGRQRHSDLGNPLESQDCVVDLSSFSRITEYTPADLTIHVQAGVTLENLQNELRANGQFLPLDPWAGNDVTMGGVASANAYGPMRAVGSIRDWIIGMTVVEVDGTVSRSGGRVVKNVTGYDLMKLYTGSIGTLAIIAELSLKLRAGYATTSTAVARFSDHASAESAFRSIRAGSTEPVAFEWAGPDHEIWVRFGEARAAVDWQLGQLPDADWQICTGGAETELWAGFRKRYTALGPNVARIIGRPADTGDMIRASGAQAWIAHAANGVVLAPVSSADEVRSLRTRFRVVIERASDELKRDAGVFGMTGAEAALVRRLKTAFDPDCRLNPGRHVDGERR